MDWMKDGKKRTFWFAMLSLFGAVFLFTVHRHNNVEDLLKMWFVFSLPLIIQIIFHVAFRGE